MLATWIERNARHRPDHTAIVHGSARFTWSKFNERIHQVTTVLRDLGVVPGDRVAVCMANRVEFIELYAACARIGAVIVPVNAWFQQQEFDHVVTDSEPRVVVVDADRVPLAEEHRTSTSSTGATPTVVVAGDALESLVASSATQRDWPVVTADSPFAILYTSGTTGPPKGAVLTHGTARAYAHDLLLHYGLFEEYLQSDRGGEGHEVVGLAALPLFFSAPSLCVFIPMWYLGATTVLMDRFEADEALAVIEAERVTYAQLVPILLHRLLRSPDFDRRDTSSLRVFGYGSAPVDPALLQESLERLPHVQLCQIYGSTEAGFTSCLRPHEHSLGHPHRLMSAGRPVLATQFKIVDDDWAEVVPGEVGRIAIKGDSVSPGYWRNPEATETTRRDGWFVPGDLGRVDEDGFLYVVGRQSDLIISGGINIYPREIEQVLAQDPRVEEAAVVGVPHPEWGEAVAAFIRLSDETAADDAVGEELRQFCRANLAAYKVPKDVVFVDDLPRGPAGKVLKRVIREEAWAGRLRQIG